MKETINRNRIYFYYNKKDDTISIASILDTQLKAFHIDLLPVARIDVALPHCDIDLAHMLSVVAYTESFATYETQRNKQGVNFF